MVFGPYDLSPPCGRLWGGGGGGNRTHGPKLFVRIIFLRNTRERCANESIMRKFVRSENEVGLGASTRRIIVTNISCRPVGQLSGRSIANCTITLTGVL